MDKICKNCEYFTQESISSTHIWGHCTNSVSSIVIGDKNRRGAFMWGDKTCSDFKPQSVDHFNKRKL